MCSPPIWGGALHYGGELKGEHFFLRIRSAPPQTGGEHKGEHFGKLGAAGENFRVLASDIDQKYIKFIKLRQIIMKLAPQAIFLGIGSKILKITSAPPPNWGGEQIHFWGEHLNFQNFAPPCAPPPFWGEHSKILPNHKKIACGANFTII